MDPSPAGNRSVVHVTGSLWKKGGGVAPVVWELAEYQVKMGFTATVVGLRDDESKDARGVHNGVPYVAADAAARPGPILRARGLKALLAEVGRGAGLVHSHGLWEYQSYAAGKFARKTRTPLVMSTHGMLEPWSIARSRWKKRLVRWLFENRNLRTARCLHATADQEADNIRALGIDKPIAIVPIGLETEPYTQADPQEARERWPELRDKRPLLFMSRIHPKKGLFNLIEAWAKLAREFADWQLVIAGPDELSHESEVRAVAEAAGIGGRVTFVGPVYGTLKTSLLAAAGLFVLPTFSENFGIVVIESLAAGVPVITTKGAPWRSVVEHECGWWIDIGVAPLLEALQAGLSLPDDQRRAMGLRGLEMVRQKHSWPEISRQMIAVYDWLLGLGERPECVALE